MKYRIWDKKHSEYIVDTGCHFVDPDGVVWFMDFDDRFYIQPEYLVIEQWTGLTDKNGTGIFEGDILGTEQLDRNLGIDVWEVDEDSDCVVEMSLMNGVSVTNGFWLTDNPDENSIFNIAYVKVIGNIHEVKS